MLSVCGKSSLPTITLSLGGLLPVQRHAYLIADRLRLCCCTSRVGDQGVLLADQRHQ